MFLFWKYPTRSIYNLGGGSTVKTGVGWCYNVGWVIRIFSPTGPRWKVALHPPMPLCYRVVGRISGGTVQGSCQSWAVTTLVHLRESAGVPTAGSVVLSCPMISWLTLRYTVAQEHHYWRKHLMYIIL